MLEIAVLQINLLPEVRGIQILKPARSILAITSLTGMGDKIFDHFDIVRAAKLNVRACKD